MRGNPHVRFGGRAEETDRPKGRHRASVRPNHTGNTLAARGGVGTRDLMTRMGHDSVRAAIIYQHATTEADARIAGSLDANIASANDGGGATDEGDDGDGVVVPLR
jgi:hypothetical protein